MAQVMLSPEGEPLALPFVPTVVTHPLRCTQQDFQIVYFHMAACLSDTNHIPGFCIDSVYVAIHSHGRESVLSTIPACLHNDSTWYIATG